MNNNRARGPIRSKVSTMPLLKSEAAKQLELYKKVTERQRIKQELVVMEQRMQLLKQRLGCLDKQIQQIQVETFHQAQEVTPEVTPVSPTQNVTARQQETETSNYTTFYIEY